MSVRSIATVKILRRLTRCAVSILLAVQLVSAAHAQNQPTPPEQYTVPVNPRVPPPATVDENLASRGGLACGGGASISSVATEPTTQCGAFVGLGPLETEAGVMGPQANRSYLSGYLSENLWIPLRPKSRSGSPVAVGGYTRMFEIGHALDYGVAYLRPIGPAGAMRYIQFDVRDYWAFANPSQHNIVFRISWIFGGGGEP